MPDENQTEARPLGRPRSARSKDAILSATRALLLKGGYGRLTIEAVARKAGVSKATIYRWWSTKGALVLEAAEAEIAIGVVPKTDDARRDIATAIDQLVETFSRPLASIVIFAAITTGGSDPVMAKIFRDKYVYPWRDSAAEVLARAMTAGRIPEGDVQFLLDVIVGTVFQRTLVLKEPSTERLRESLIALISPKGQHHQPTGSPPPRKT